VFKKNLSFCLPLLVLPLVLHLPTVGVEVIIAPDHTQSHTHTHTVGVL